MDVDMHPNFDNPLFVMCQAHFKRTPCICLSTIKCRSYSDVTFWYCSYFNINHFFPQISTLFAMIPDLIYKFIVSKITTGFFKTHLQIP